VKIRLIGEKLKEGQTGKVSGWQRDRLAKDQVYIGTGWHRDRFT